MRRIYLLSADADADAAGKIEALLKQRGWQVRRAEEARHYPPAYPGEVTLALWSSRVLLSSTQLMFTNRAIDAWGDGRLVLAHLDLSIRPHGLRDMASIDLSFSPGWIGTIPKVLEAAEAIDRAASAADEADDRSGPPGGAPPMPRMAPAPKLEKKRTSGWFRFGRSKSAVPPAAAPAPIPAPSPSPPPAESASPVAELDVFISYSRQNSATVYPLVESVQAAGHTVWIDREGLEAGTHWAATIVRAIKSAETFCLMCSAESFQSDNVRREIYLANKYKRRLLPVRLDGAEMPEDFEYFLIDRQWLDLAGVQPNERAERLRAALAE